MTAIEAREKAKEVNILSENSQYMGIMKVITSAVQKGKYECFVYEHIKSDVSEKLKSDGYKISNDYGRFNETTIEISW